MATSRFRIVGGPILGPAAPSRSPTRLRESTSPKDPATARLETTYKLLELFRREIWPRYCADPLELRIQADLREVAGTIYWDNTRGAYQLVCRPTGDVQLDLAMLLHEAGHVVTGHAAKHAAPPSWVGPTGRVDERRLLETIRSRPATVDAMMAGREREAEAWTDRELAKLRAAAPGRR